MTTSFRKAIDIRYIRFSAKTDTLEKWIYHMTSISLENPLLTTMITMTVGAIFLIVLLLLTSVFAGVICLTSIILVTEGFLLIVVTVTVILLIVICSYVYVVGISLCVYFKSSTELAR